MKVKKVLVLLSVLVLSLSSIHGVKAETNYTDSTSSVSYNTDSPISSDVSTSNDAGKCDVRVSQTSTFSVTIPKTIVLNGGVGSDNSATYTVGVNANIASDEVIVVAPPESFQMADAKGIKTSTKTANISQSVTRFVESETKTNQFSSRDEYTSIARASEGAEGTTSVDGSVTVENLTAGAWQGTFNFNISLSSFLNN